MPLTPAPPPALKPALVTTARDCRSASRGVPRRLGSLAARPVAPPLWDASGVTLGHTLHTFTFHRLQRSGKYIILGDLNGCEPSGSALSSRPLQFPLLAGGKSRRQSAPPTPCGQPRFGARAGPWWGLSPPVGGLPAGLPLPPLVNERGVPALSWRTPLSASPSFFSASFLRGLVCCYPPFPPSDQRE